MGWKPTSGGGSSPLTTKGDLYGYSTVDARIPVGSNGHVLTADSAQTLGVKWASPGGGGGGVWEGAPATTYVLPGLEIGEKGTGAIASGTLTYHPILVREPIHVETLAGEVTGGNAGGRAMRVGLYEATWQLQPGARIAEGEFSAATTGIKTVTVDQTIPAGRYLIARITNDSTPTWRFVRLRLGNLLIFGTDNVVNGLQITTSYGALPDPGTAWNTLGANVTGFAGAVWLSVTEP